MKFGKDEVIAVSLVAGGLAVSAFTMVVSDTHLNTIFNPVIVSQDAPTPPGHGGIALQRKLN